LGITVQHQGHKGHDAASGRNQKCYVDPRNKILPKKQTFAGWCHEAAGSDTNTMEREALAERSTRTLG